MADTKREDQLSLTNVSRNSFDVVIIGAGISGIDAAYRIKTELPDFNFTILEARSTIGGTWDVSRYPGLRSDSDLFTFGFPWRPWKQPKVIADGESILNYIEDAATAEGLDRHLRFHHRLLSASWSTKKQTWSVTVRANSGIIHLHARFLVMGSGYYNYEEPLPVTIPGLKSFRGPVAHPQFWPEDLDYSEKRVVIIGSGATAITLVPSLAEKAAHVTMLQRSPSYILALPNPSSGSWLHRTLPESLAFKLQRLQFILFPFPL